ncbi:MAG: response regulator transcription factor [Acidobacteriota bacterium]|nr:response regulator transcription factor [Acidobacteriota bacterium]
MPQIRILLVDGHTLFREGLRALFEMEGGLEVAGEAADGSEAVMKYAEVRPDLILMEIGMPGLSSFEAVRQIRKLPIPTRICFLTTYDEEDYLVEAMELGAAGYILKDTRSVELIEAIREIHRGGTYLSPRMLTRLVVDFQGRGLAGIDRKRGSVLRSSTVTAREKEVIKLIAEGNSTKQIAWILRLSVKTIEAHKFNLMRKLDIHNRAHLVQYAFEKRIVRMPATA